MKILIIHGEKPERNGAINKEFLSRLDKAIELNQKNEFGSIIISGGQTRKTAPSEARQGLEYLKNKIESKIILEEKSKTSLENIRYTKTVIKNLGIFSQNLEAYVVSSETRIPRLKYLYSKIFPEIYPARKFVSAKDSYGVFYRIMEKIYYFIALVDPQERILPELKKKIFRNG